MPKFTSREPTLEEYWRGIVLFGRNVASYKFALAKSLLELKPQAGELLKLEEIAPAFSRHITDHLKKSDKQATSRSSKFLDACRSFNQGELEENQLIETTVKMGFNNVIDAFHVVGQGEIPKRFYLDERKSNGGIRITDEFNILLEKSSSIDLPHEVEARWRLVETAWELNVSRGLVGIDYDLETEGLFAIDGKLRRKSVTSCRDALNGYQKGKCFYCFTPISLEQEEMMPDVDHFFPHVLKGHGLGPTVDGVWNLVLSCKECNRGANGKFEKVPKVRLLERLHTRNEFLIGSHHPLRETLIKQTGKTEQERKVFLNDVHLRAKTTLLHEWEPKEEETPSF